MAAQDDGDAHRIRCVCVDTYQDELVVDRIYQPRFWRRSSHPVFGRIIEEIEIRDDLGFDYDNDFIVRCRPQEYEDEVVAKHEAFTETLYRKELAESQHTERVRYHQESASSSSKIMSRP